MLKFFSSPNCIPITINSYSTSFNYNSLSLNQTFYPSHYKTVTKSFSIQYKQWIPCQEH